MQKNTKNQVLPCLLLWHIFVTHTYVSMFMPEKDLTKQACKLNGRANSNAAFYGVEDTIYIPLASRIRISKKFPQYFLDTKALELEKKIPQAAQKMHIKEYENMAAVARYFNIDKIVRRFIARTSNGNIINLGAGLDTMYHRIVSGCSNATAHTSKMEHTFYELDVPDVIKLRRPLLAEEEKDVLIEGKIKNILIYLIIII